MGARHVSDIGRTLAEGKTKVIQEALRDGERAMLAHDALDVLTSKNNISAYEGIRKDVIEGKAAIANRTTVNIFRFLQACGVPLAFVEGYDDTRFVARHCTMLPWEVVVRTSAHGSHLQRYPHLKKDELLARPLVQFFLKTSGKRFGEHTLVEDDPIALPTEGKHGIGMARIHHPKKPTVEYQPGIVLSDDQNARASFFFETPYEQSAQMFEEMARIAVEAFILLEHAWRMQGIRLLDYKVEFGITTSGTLVLADVIDADSGRLYERGHYIDKQVYREGGSIEEVFANYARIERMTERFIRPVSELYVWTGSTKDKIDVFRKAFEDILGDHDGIAKFMSITASAHKDAPGVIAALRRIENGSVANKVILACVGRSNGLGPVLAGHSFIPIVSVPLGGMEAEHDLFSSLSLPSQVPAATIVEPANAVQFALNILAQHDPLIALRLRQHRARALEHPLYDVE